MSNKKIHTVTFLLLLVGGLNWLLVGVADMNVVNMAFGSMPMVEKVIYILVGLSAAYELMNHKKMCVNCGATGA